MMPSICKKAIVSGGSLWLGVEPTHNKQPAPARKTVQPVHGLVDSRLEKSTEHSTSQARASEDGAALAQLLFGVPRAKDEVSAGKHARLGVSLEEADDHDVLGTLRSSCAHCEGSPDDNHQRKEDSWSKASEQQVVGDNSTACRVSYQFG